jgi:hypothetical protein
MDSGMITNSRLDRGVLCRSVDEFSILVARLRSSGGVLLNECAGYRPSAQAQFTPKEALFIGE